jgi:hypothetical protein
MQDNTNKPGGWTLKEKVVFSLIGLGVGGTMGYFLLRWYRNSKANIEENKSYKEGEPAFYAKKLKMAFDYTWGTDEEAIREVMKAMPSRAFFKQVMDSYLSISKGDNLMRDLADELQPSEYTEMLTILAAKPETGKTLVSVQVSPAQYLSWAKRLKVAFDMQNWIFPGTDTEAVKAVFMEIPTQAAWTEVVKAYNKEYQPNDLMNDLLHELEFYEYSSIMGIIKKKPKA